MFFDYSFDTSAAFCPAAWAAEVAAYENALRIANLEARAVQANTPEEFRAVFAQLIDAQAQRTDLAIRRLNARMQPKDRKEVEPWTP